MKIVIYIIYIILITNLNASATDEQRKLFEENCNDGKSISCYNMGLMYEHGDGVDKDNEKALSFYIKACDKNYFTSCSKAAVLYEEGQGIKKDMKEAFKLYTKACGGEDGFGCHNVAVYYSKKETQAMKNISLGLYDKACDNGYAPSCIYLGRMYRDSKSLTHDYQMAKEKFNLACEANNYLGCKELRILEEAGY
ncbi:hypothetical protein SAMN06314019_1036 [Epsilonproteobacteria bacterium SCGC AD-311-C15]|nr:hypothetical protein SAMN06314019_1036 [Epsilonproteobacteria bacterium SCGC AD-311-C15]